VSPMLGFSCFNIKNIIKLQVINLNDNVSIILWEHMEQIGMNILNIKHSKALHKHCFHYLKKYLSEFKWIKNDIIMNNNYPYLYIIL